MKKKNIYIAVAVILIAAVVYFVFYKKKGEKTTVVSSESEEEKKETLKNAVKSVDTTPEGNEAFNDVVSTVSYDDVPEPRIVM